MAESSRRYNLRDTRKKEVVENGDEYIPLSDTEEEFVEEISVVDIKPISLMPLVIDSKPNITASSEPEQTHSIGDQERQDQHNAATQKANSFRQKRNFSGDKNDESEIMTNENGQNCCIYSSTITQTNVKAGPEDKHEILDPKQMASQETDLFNIPSFDQSFNFKVNRKRRGDSVTLSEGTTAANAPANRPATPPPANPPKRFAGESGDVTDNGDVSWLNLVPETHLSSWTHERVVTNKKVRDRNKNFRYIYEEEGLDYGNDVSAVELNSRMSSSVKLRQASVAKMFKILNASRDVQLCFLVDVTGSMAKYIDEVRDSIFKIVEKLTEKHVAAAGHSAIAKKVFLAFVGYRDFGYENQFELHSFTEIVENFRQFCSRIQTSMPKFGTIGDAPEDVFGGLEKAITDLSWSDSMCTKIIFHIADHPCHGKKYHASNYRWYDRYPDGDPNGHTAENFFNALREKGIQYHFGKITEHTNKMIELFSEAIGNEIEVFDIKQIGTLVDNVISSVSIGTSMHPAMRAKQHIFKIERTVPDWSKLWTFTGVFLSYDMPGSIDEVISGIPLDQKHPTKAKIQIAEHPFAHGVERKTFYGRDLTRNTSTDIVLKEYIRQKTDTASRSAVVPYEIATQMQTIAAYLASVFSDCLQKKAGIVYDIKFLKVQVLAIDIKPGHKRYMSCERRYGNDSKFLRFSNNADYEMLACTCKANDLDFEVVELLMAFSHWTYQSSHGFLMVVDLQGIISSDKDGHKTLELTDPAIHSIDLTRFGKTNFGFEGMKTFFGRHVCNKFCQSIDLKPPAL